MVFSVSPNRLRFRGGSMADKLRIVRLASECALKDLDYVADFAGYGEITLKVKPGEASSMGEAFGR